ncbi:MAG: hypothetical protein WDZ82_02580 [Candidatus Paceibacterota bacterium]
MKHLPTQQRVNTQSGQTLFVATIFFLVISLLVILGVADPIMRHLSNTIETRDSKTSFYLAESLQEDVVYRIKNGMNVEDTEFLSLNGHTATAEITNILNGKSIRSTGNVNSINRNVETMILLGDGIAFNFGIQSDSGGIILKNSASVVGNAFSNGTIEGAGNMIYGSAISAGPDGLIDDIHATGTIYAHTIKDAWTEKDAFFFSDSTISNTTVEGTRYPDSEDQATSTLPISDEQIEKWKDGAVEGGVNDCGGESSYQIKSDETIGPIKFECDLQVQGGGTVVTIGGPVWVEGDITVQNSAIFRIDTDLDNKSVAIIADYPSDPTSKGTIDLQNNTEFEGTGEEGSYILFVSQNSSAEEGGGTEAIKIQNSAVGDLLLYAGHGKVVLQNNVSLREVTAYLIEAQNSAEVIYETGMANLLFDSGPAGGYEISSWREVE